MADDASFSTPFECGWRFGCVWLYHSRNLLGASRLERLLGDAHKSREAWESFVDSLGPGQGIAESLAQAILGEPVTSQTSDEFWEGVGKLVGTPESVEGSRDEQWLRGFAAGVSETLEQFRSVASMGYTERHDAIADLAEAEEQLSGFDEQLADIDRLIALPGATPEVAQARDKLAAQLAALKEVRDKAANQSRKIEADLERWLREFDAEWEQLFGDAAGGP